MRAHVAVSNLLWGTTYTLSQACGYGVHVGHVIITQQPSSGFHLYFVALSLVLCVAATSLQKQLDFSTWAFPGAGFREVEAG